MPNITLHVPDELYEKMKRHREVRWSEVVRRAIADYIRKLEAEATTEELLEELGGKFAAELSEISVERAVRWYEEARRAEWRRYSTTRAA